MDDRKFFAGCALVGLMINLEDDGSDGARIAERAFKIADAMVKAGGGSRAERGAFKRAFDSSSEGGFGGGGGGRWEGKRDRGSWDRGEAGSRGGDRERGASGDRERGDRGEGGEKKPYERKSYDKKPYEKKPYEKKTFGTSDKPFDKKRTSFDPKKKPGLGRKPSGKKRP